jgi:hypothetical protein
VAKVAISSVSLPRGKPQEGFVMPNKITRRYFIEVVFASTTVAAVTGASVLWPSNALSRPIYEPACLTIDEYNYIIDPHFDYCETEFPTFREHHSLEGLNPAELKARINEDVGLIEHIVSDVDNWSVDEIEEWLDTQIEIDDLGPWNSMQYTQHGPALEIYQQMDRKDAEELGLELDECSSMCSNFVGIAFYGDPAKLSRGFERLGMNVVVT